MKKAFKSFCDFFKRAGLWFKNHAPTRRRIIQLYAALLTNANIKGLFNGRIYTGATKNVCVPGLNCYSCPSTVGACPLGALQNALASSDTKTPVYIIGILALLGIMLGRTICGFLCPTGLLQDLLYKIKTPKLKKSRITRILSYFKYVLLIVLVIALPLGFMLKDFPLPAFCKYICPSGTLGGAILLLINPLNADMYGMLGALFTWKFVVLVVILAASVMMYRPFCRFICPLGAIYGFFNRLALLGVKVEKDKCVDCGLCVAHCKMDVKHVGDHECINCGECIPVCPTKAIVWKGSSIFVKPNDTESQLAVKVPLTNFVKPLPSSQTAPVQEISADMADMMAIEGAPSPAPAAQAAAAARPMVKVPNIRIGLKAQRVLKIVAASLAAALLIGAIIYYNFFDVSAPLNLHSALKVGDECPQFTVQAYTGESDKFSTAEHEGDVLVINFWYTTCGPCIEELPEFIELAEKYSDETTFVALHSSDPALIDDGVTEFLERKGWLDTEIVFAQDEDQESGMSLYETFGGKSAYPMTIVVDADGIISATTQGKWSGEKLEAAILEALN